MAVISWKLSNSGKECYIASGRRKFFIGSTKSNGSMLESINGRTSPYTMAKDLTYLIIYILSSKISKVGLKYPLIIEDPPMPS